jgi:hypothetical protein
MESAMFRCGTHWEPLMAWSVYWGNFDLLKAISDFPLPYIAIVIYISTPCTYSKDRIHENILLMHINVVVHP